jgi:secreted trypsin-like serine protease
MEKLALVMVNYDLLVNFSNLKNQIHFFSGDSGGGMVLKVGGLKKIIGIVSAAVAKSATVGGKNTSICDLDNYLVYTDVSKFYNWIEQVVLETPIN